MSLQDAERETIDSRLVQLETKVRIQLGARFLELGLNRFPECLYFLAFKKEQLLEVYVQQHSKRWSLLKTYPFTAFSGVLGPKRSEGDGQIPEGLYVTEYLNPNSAFYLSVKISYPNSVDLIRSKEAGFSHPGSNIFMHGGAQSTGCIAIGDAAMEEVFVLTAKAKCPSKVVISPCDLSADEEWMCDAADNSMAATYAAIADAIREVKKTGGGE